MFDAEHIARLARMGLSESEKPKFEKDLSAILEFVEKLKEVNVRDVEPTAQATGLENVIRADEAAKREPELKERLLANAPDRKDSYIKVKEVFE